MESYMVLKHLFEICFGAKVYENDNSLEIVELFLRCQIHSILDWFDFFFFCWYIDHREVLNPKVVPLNPKMGKKMFHTFSDGISLKVNK